MAMAFDSANFDRTLGYNKLRRIVDAVAFDRTPRDGFCEYLGPEFRAGSAAHRDKQQFFIRVDNDKKQEVIGRLTALGIKGIDQNDAYVGQGISIALEANPDFQKIIAAEYGRRVLVEALEQSDVRPEDREMNTRILAKAVVGAAKDRDIGFEMLTGAVTKAVGEMRRS
jgi:hypothetical protein